MKKSKAFIPLLLPISLVGFISCQEKKPPNHENTKYMKPEIVLFRVFDVSCFRGKSLIFGFRLDGLCFDEKRKDHIFDRRHRLYSPGVSRHPGIIEFKGASDQRNIRIYPHAAKAH